jgi:hypothetical protein
MTERPILMSGAMVRAVLNGTKTQTRRAVKFSESDMETFINSVPNKAACCPYGHIGDRLWVRENFHPVFAQDPTYNNGQPIEIDYAATYKQGDRLITPKWTPSIHMPRWASRILLEIVSVRVEQLQCISEVDALAEGITITGDGAYHVEDDKFRAPSAKESYARLWESINGDGSWSANPWVWVIEFKEKK